MDDESGDDEKDELTRWIETRLMTSDEAELND